MLGPHPYVRLLAMLALTATASTLSGCGSAIVREWQSLYTVAGGELNRLVAYDDGTAKVTLFATTTGTPDVWTRFVFGGTWVEDDYTFVFELTCREGPCNGDDFQLRCQVIDEDNGKTWKLDCVGNNKWANYPFSWQEVL